MAFDMAKISVKARHKPPMMLLVGKSKLGKTSFCAGNRVVNGEIVEWGLNKPIILWLKGEEGADAIPVAKNSDPITSYDELMEALAWLAKEDHEFQTVAIDSLTTLVEIIKAHVQKTEPELATDSKYNQYGNGNKRAVTFHRNIADALTWLRDNKNMTVIMTGHIKPTPKDIPDPEKGLYAAWCADIPDGIYAMYDRSFDVVLYADTKDITTEKDIGMGNKQGKIVNLNNGERFLFTKKTLAHPSGGRGIYGHLRNEIPFDWASFQEAVAEAISYNNNNNN